MKKFIALLIIIVLGVIAAFIADKIKNKPIIEDQKTVNIYFIKVRNGGNSKYVAVKRLYKSEEKKFKTAIEELLKGPNKEEQKEGIYSAIPEGTKLLSIDENSVKITINLSPHYEFGGGTTSMIHRIDQLVKTSIDATKKPVYLEIEGEQVEVIGGEGILIEQPLDKNLKLLEQNGQS